MTNLRKSAKVSYFPSPCKNPIDNAFNPNLKKPLNKFAQLFIIYLRLSKADILLGMVQSSTA